MIVEIGVHAFVENLGNVFNCLINRSLWRVSLDTEYEILVICSRNLDWNDWILVILKCLLAFHN